MSRLQREPLLRLDFEKYNPPLEFHHDPVAHQMATRRGFKSILIHLVDLHHLSRPQSTSQLFPPSEWGEDLVFGRCECVEHPANCSPRRCRPLGASAEKGRMPKVEEQDSSCPGIKSGAPKSRIKRPIPLSRDCAAQRSTGKSTVQSSGTTTPTTCGPNSGSVPTPRSRTSSLPPTTIRSSRGASHTANANKSGQQANKMGQPRSSSSATPRSATQLLIADGKPIMGHGKRICETGNHKAANQKLLENEIVQRLKSVIQRSYNHHDPRAIPGVRHYAAEPKSWGRPPLKSGGALRPVGRLLSTNQDIPKRSASYSDHFHHRDRNILNRKAASNCRQHSPTITSSITDPTPINIRSSGERYPLPLGLHRPQLRYLNARVSEPLRERQQRVDDYREVRPRYGQSFLEVPPSDNTQASLESFCTTRSQRAGRKGRRLEGMSIVGGLPEDVFASTLAHELTHAYIFAAGKYN